MAKVLFVHGWNASKSPFLLEDRLLREIFPEADDINFFRWNSDQDWYNALLASEHASDQLATFLQEQSSPGEWILVGHSLGARIVVSALNQISCRVRRVVLLGAAVPASPLQPLKTASEHSREEMWNVHGENDLALKLYQIVEGDEALGAAPPPDFYHFRNIAVPPIINYLNFIHFIVNLVHLEFGMEKLNPELLKDLGLDDIIQHGSEHYLKSLLTIVS